MATFDLDDAIKDGNGKYKYNGRFAWICTDDGLERLKDNKLLKGTQIRQVKTYCKHIKHPDFKSEVIYASNKFHKFPNNSLIVVYYFTGKEHDIVPEPHGYSKVKKMGLLP